MQSYIELAKEIGKTVLISDGDGVKYQAKIVDVKVSYGSARYKVVPVAGVGEKWVMSFTELKP